MVERRLAAILNADVVAYTRLMADDEVATLETLNACWGLIAGLVRQHGGRVVDMVGDNLLAEFPSAVDAVQCAVEIQRQLKTINSTVTPTRRMLLRIGLNVGDQERDDIAEGSQGAEVLWLDDRRFGQGVLQGR